MERRKRHALPVAVSKRRSDATKFVASTDVRRAGAPAPQVLEAIAAARRVCWGQTTTYGTLARALGFGPEAARDVGQATAKNPVPLIIPCHRVLAAGSKAGVFSAPGRSAAKLYVLKLEGVHIGASPAAQQSLGL